MASNTSALVPEEERVGQRTADDGASVLQKFHRANDFKSFFDDLSPRQKLIGIGCFGGAFALSTISSFQLALGRVKKSDKVHYNKGLISGDAFGLASKALLRGTVYAVGGFSFFCLVTYKLLGLNSLSDLRPKMESLLKGKLPDIPRNKVQGRSEFGSFRELFEHLEEEDKKKKAAKSD